MPTPVESLSFRRKPTKFSGELTTLSDPVSQAVRSSRDKITHRRSSRSFDCERFRTRLISFRCFGRRVLACAPLHNHFVFRGVHEVKIVVRFWIIAALLAIAGFASLRLL